MIMQESIFFITAAALVTVCYGSVASIQNEGTACFMIATELPKLQSLDGKSESQRCPTPSPHTPTVIPSLTKVRHLKLQ